MKCQSRGLRRSQVECTIRDPPSYLLWTALTKCSMLKMTALLDTPVNLSVIFGVAVETFTERFVETQKQLKTISYFLLKQDCTSLLLQLGASMNRQWTKTAVVEESDAPL